MDCAARVLLKFRRSEGCDRPDCPGWAHNRTHARAHREAPFVAVTKGRPSSTAAVPATTYKWLGARFGALIHSSRRQHSTTNVLVSPLSVVLLGYRLVR